MNNAAIAQVFQDMADLLELKEDNPLKSGLTRRLPAPSKPCPRNWSR